MQPDYSINPAAEQAAASIALPAIVPFKFQNHPVRVVMIDGTKFFITVDLAPILGVKNARQAVRSHVSKEDRKGVQSVDTLEGKQTLLAVNESGVYALVFGSTKPEAQAFKRWITSEVIPTIRKTGRYELAEQRVPALLRQIAGMLQGRGVAKERQLNRIVAHRDGSFSFRIGKRWTRKVQPLDACALPLAHGLREGLAISALNLVQKIQPRFQLH